MMMTKPVMMRLLGSLAPICARPASSTAMMSTPKKVLTTEPRPPIRLVPPITTAAITCSSAPVPAFGSAASRRDDRKMPPRPASSPAMANTMMRIGRGSTPASRMASSLVPMPTTWRPNTVRVSTTCARATIAIAMKKAGERPAIHGLPRKSILEPMYCVRESVAM